jgi:hypothetical protein
MDAVVERFAEQSPITSVARLALLRALEPQWIDALGAAVSVQVGAPMGGARSHTSDASFANDTRETWTVRLQRILLSGGRMRQSRTSGSEGGRAGDCSVYQTLFAFARNLGKTQA